MVACGAATELSRLALSYLHTSATAALGGNLGGITSWLLGLDGGRLAAKLHADVLVPVRGFKRCVDAANGYGELHAMPLANFELLASAQ